MDPYECGVGEHWEPLKVCRQTSGIGHFSPLEYVPGSVHRVGGLRESRSSENFVAVCCCESLYQDRRPNRGPELDC